MDDKLHYENGWLIIKNFVRHQRVNPSIKKGIKKALETLPSWLKRRLAIIEKDDQISIEITKITEVNTQSGYSLGTDSPQRNNNNNLTESNLTKTNKGLKSLSDAKRVTTAEIDEMFDYWSSKVGYSVTSQLKSNREYCGKLVKEYTITDLKRMIDGVALSHSDRYAPRINNFAQLYRKWDDLKAWGIRMQQEKNSTEAVRL